MAANWQLGVDLGGTKTEVLLMDSASRELFRKRVATPAGDYRATLATIRDLVMEAESRVGAENLPVGIGIPGSVSGVTGRVKNGNSTWLNGQPMAEDLRRILRRPVTLTNDANCLALSEARDGAGQGYSVVFAAILGTGCGAGISVNGQLLSGPNGVAGEWGHNPLAWMSEAELTQRPCFCGRSGCNETFLSGPGLAATHRFLAGHQASALAIAARAVQGDPAAVQTMGVYLDHLARGLAAVVNLLDPDVIVLGGGLSNIDLLYQALPERLPAYVFGGECATPVVRAAHGDSSGVRGAAWLSA